MEKMRLNYDKEQLEAVIDKVAERTMNMDMTWDWPCGVAYYGMAEAYEATGNKKYLDMVKERVDEVIRLGLVCNIYMVYGKNKNRQY